MHNPLASRRNFLKATTAGFGHLAFAGIAAAQSNVAKNTSRTHHQPRAKRVIFLCMEGAPSHVETFDHKPELYKSDGRSFGAGRASGTLRSPITPFSQHGESGLWISDLFPQIATQADHLCLLNGMHTDLPAHAQAFIKMHTGNSQFPRPSLGSWTFYGLGTENENLPGFITISPPSKNGGAGNYASAFLPAMYQATPIGRSGRPIADATVANLVNNRKSSRAQRLQLDYLKSINQGQLQREQINPQIEGVIESYELAFRMQAEMPELLDLSKESAATLEAYGIDSEATDDFGRQCLLARRLSEAGVRFVEICCPNWDHHTQLSTRLPESCASVDQPVAALLDDLDRRGLLDETLVVWGGEFGRTPYAQGSDGRDHNAKGYTMWMAGGGVRGGLAYGGTDEVGYEAVEGKVHIHDWHATVLHLLGLNHEALTYRYAGRDFRLTDTRGFVIDDIIA
ncbi:MAG: DUF1501 domain-containing protein [Planctomycetota bacterium]|jgi:hypothetical protein